MTFLYRTTTLLAILAIAGSQASAQTGTIVRGSLDLAIGPFGALPTPTNYRVGAGTGEDFDGEFIGDFAPTDVLRVTDLYALVDRGAGCNLTGGKFVIRLFARTNPAVFNTSTVNATFRRDCGSPDFRQVGVACSSGTEPAEYGAPGKSATFGLGAYDNQGLIDLRITWLRDATGGCAVAELVGTATLTVGPPVTPVPAELTEFSATTEGGTDVVTWSTASEIDVDRFVVERSVGGADAFAPVGEHAAEGGAGTPARYRLGFPAPAGTRYYRLVSADADGTADTSATVALGGDAPEGLLRAYPNPASGLLYLSPTDLSAGPVQVSIYDALGRVILEAPGELSAGILPLDVSGLPPGRYRVAVQRDGAVSTAAFQVGE